MKKFFAAALAAAMLLMPAMFGCASETPEEPDDSLPPPVTTIEGYTVASEEAVNSFDPSVLRIFGRTYQTTGKLNLDNAATGFEVTFYGTNLSVKFAPTTTYLYMRYFVDDDAEGKFVNVRSGAHRMAKDLEEGVHTVRVVKSTSSQNGIIRVTEISTDGSFLVPKESSAPRIEFVGDSITVGAGVFGQSSDLCKVENSDAARSYAYRTAMALGAQSTCSFVATEGICTKAKSALQVNMLEMYGGHSSTNTTPLSESVQYDVVVVALGTNDSYYMSNHPEYTEAQFIADYQELLGLIRTRNPAAKIVCIYGLMEKNPVVERGIKAAVASMEGASYLEVPRDTAGAQAHPSEAGAIKQSAVLTDYLRQILG